MPGQTTFDFVGKSAIVSGSTKGIGRGIAEGLVKAGANVVINSRTEASVRETVDELEELAEGKVIGVVGDVGQPSDIERLVNRSFDEFGRVDILVNNAAVWPREESMVDASLDDWDQTMNVNVRAQFYASKLVARRMIEEDIQGVIINHTSQTGDRRAGGRGLYGVSNTAINGLTWRMAHDLAQYGIRMNAVSTYATDSYQLRKEAELIAEDEADLTPDDILDQWAEDTPLGRLGQPTDIANTVMWLASEQAGYVVGTIVRVSGGGNLQ